MCPKIGHLCLSAGTLWPKRNNRRQVVFIWPVRAKAEGAPGNGRAPLSAAHWTRVSNFVAGGGWRDVDKPAKHLLALFQRAGGCDTIHLGAAGDTIGRQYMAGQNTKSSVKVPLRSDTARTVLHPYQTMQPGRRE